MSDAARAKTKEVVRISGETGETIVDAFTKALDAHSAEQTAVLREENARLRVALGNLLKSADASWEETEGSDMGHDWAQACSAARSLLTDPEGQRAGEEWRLREALGAALGQGLMALMSEAVGALRALGDVQIDGDWERRYFPAPLSLALQRCMEALAAVERARQP